MEYIELALAVMAGYGSYLGLKALYDTTKAKKIESKSSKTLKNIKSSKKEITYLIKESVVSNMLGEVQSIKYKLERQGLDKHFVYLPTLSKFKQSSGLHYAVSKTYTDNLLLAKEYKEFLEKKETIGGYHVIPVDDDGLVVYICSDTTDEDYWSDESISNKFYDKDEAVLWCMVNGSQIHESTLDEDF